jgi:hypothetical protein
MPEFRFVILQGWQKHARNQGIKLQGMQNLVRDSVLIFTRYAKPSPRFSLDFCTGGKTFPKIQFAFCQVCNEAN